MQILTGHIENIVLTALLEDGPLTTSELLDRAFRKNQYTKQGVYRVLRKLKREEKVVIYKSTVSVNALWRAHMQTLLSGHDVAAPLIGDVQNLKKSDRLSLKIRGLSNADRVWTQLFVPLEQTLPRKHPLFLYNSHNWTGLLRRDVDQAHAKRLEEGRRPAYLMVGSTSELDKAVTRTVQSTYLEYAFNARVRAPFSVAVVSDYLFTFKLLGNGNTRVHALFIKERDPETAKRALEKLDPKTACRIIVEKNPAKAAVWKKRIGQDFYIPKQYRDF